jgi:hypothetical protein
MKPLHPVLLILGVGASVSFAEPQQGATVSSMLDANLNGMSDPWERRFNQGELFLPSNPDHAPEADPDFDGWSNLRESIAGTNPFDGSSPAGFLHTQLEFLGGEQETGPDGQTIVQAPGELMLTWPSQPGKRYTVYSSADPLMATWQSVGGSIGGADGTPPEPSFGTFFDSCRINLLREDGTFTPRLFFKTEVRDYDTDLDGLTDHEEYLLKTHPEKPETLSGFPDLWLAEYLQLHPADDLATIDINASLAEGGNLLEHILSGVNPGDPEAGNLPWVAVSGTGDSENVRNRQLRVGAGCSRALVVMVSSAEFPKWTDPLSSPQYNDRLKWKITPSSGEVIEGQLDVNSRHFQWLGAKQRHQIVRGMPGPVHYETTVLVCAPPGEELEFEVQVSAMNVGDAILPSQVAVGLVPLDQLPASE